MPHRPIQQAVDRTDAICQEQAGDDTTVETGKAALAQFGLSPDELTDIALERTKDAIATHGDDPTLIGSMMFTSAFSGEGGPVTLDGAVELNQAIAKSGMSLEDFRQSMETIVGQPSRPLVPLPPPSRRQHALNALDEVVDEAASWASDFLIVFARPLAAALLLLSIWLSAHGS